MDLNVLVLGSGGREHALTWAISKSPRIGDLFVAPGNGGTAAIAQNIPLSITDPDAILGFCKDHEIDLVVVGPELPLVEGVAEALRKAGLWFSHYGLQLVVLVWDGTNITLAAHAATEFLPCLR